MQPGVFQCSFPPPANPSVPEPVSSIAIPLSHPDPLPLIRRHDRKHAHCPHMLRSCWAACSNCFRSSRAVSGSIFRTGKLLPGSCNWRPMTPPGFKSRGTFPSTPPEGPAPPPGWTPHCGRPSGTARNWSGTTGWTARRRPSPFFSAQEKEKSLPSFLWKKGIRISPFSFRRFLRLHDQTPTQKNKPGRMKSARVY